MNGIRLIVGSGRSGTTWVQDALAEANNLRPVFEPLHPKVSEIGAKYAYRALSSDEEHPQLWQFLEEACEGKRYKLWTQYRRPGNRLLPALRNLRTLHAAKVEYHRLAKFLRDSPKFFEASQRQVPIAKCIRANLMLDWLVNRCSCKPVLIVRHPCAVIESQYRLGHDAVWDPEPVLRRYRSDTRLQQISDGRYRNLLERKLGTIEALTLNWVIENQMAMARARLNGVTVIFYERLRACPAIEWKRICDTLELDHLPSTFDLARPSQQSSRQFVESGIDETARPRWRQGLSTSQLRSIESVLDETNCRIYDVSKSDPVESIISSQ